MTEQNTVSDTHKNGTICERERIVNSSSKIARQISLRGLDGYKLGGVHFEAIGQSEPSMAAVFAGGGGILAAKYRHFATFLAMSGIPVLTFDYRGIGMSRPSRLRGLKATAEDWSECDCGGAIAWMRARYPLAKLAGVAHSIGTLLIGGAPNVNEFSRLLFVGAHTGYYRDYLPRYRAPMAFLWHGVMPLLTRIVGYFPGKVLRLGEDLPSGIALQWAARRTADLRPESTDSDPARARQMLARYAAISLPTLALSFRDDSFATEAGTLRLLGAYPALRAAIRTIDPESVGMEAIGHFGFFKTCRGNESMANCACISRGKNR